MLRTILAITGKPGLFKIVSQGKNLLVIENLITKKRTPAHSRDKIVSLGDIAIYTNAEEIALANVFEKVFEKTEGKKVDMTQYATPDELRNYFAEILPDYDQDRVYDNDIKKLFTWFNILLDAGFKEFIKKEETEK